MTITEVYYERLFKTEKFENERIGLTAKVEPGESAEEVLQCLKNRVVTSSTVFSKLLKEAQTILKNKRKHTGVEVEWAGAVMKGETSLSLEEYEDLFDVDTTLGEHWND